MDAAKAGTEVVNSGGKVLDIVDIKNDHLDGVTDAAKTTSTAQCGIFKRPSRKLVRPY